MSYSSRKHRHKRASRYTEPSYDPSHTYAGTEDEMFYDYGLNPYTSQSSGSSMFPIATASYHPPVYSDPYEVAPSPSESEIANLLAQSDQHPSTTGNEDRPVEPKGTTEDVLDGETWARIPEQERRRNIPDVGVGGGGMDGESGSNDIASSDDEDIVASFQSPDDGNVKTKGKGKNVSFGTAQHAFVDTHYTHDGPTSKSKSQSSAVNWFGGREKKSGPRHAKTRWGEDRLDIEEEPMTPVKYGTRSNDIDTGSGVASNMSKTAVQAVQGFTSRGAPDLTSFASAPSTTTSSGGNRSRVVSYRPSDDLMKKIRKTGTLSDNSILALRDWSTNVPKTHDTLDFSSWMQEAGFSWTPGGSYKSSSRRGELSGSVRFAALLDGISGLRDLRSDLRRDLTNDSWARYEKYYHKHLGKNR